MGKSKKSSGVSVEDAIKDYENILIFIYKNKDRFKNGDSKDKELGEREFENLVNSLSRYKVCYQTNDLLKNLKDYKEAFISEYIETIEKTLMDYYLYNANNAKNSSDREKIIKAMLKIGIETKSLIFFKRTEKFDDLMKCLNDASFSSLLEEIGNEEFLNEEDIANILWLFYVDEDKGAASTDDPEGNHKSDSIQYLDLPMKTKILLIANGLYKIENLINIMKSEDGNKHLRGIGLNAQDIKYLGNQLKKLGLLNSIKEKQETLDTLSIEGRIEPTK